MYAAATWPWPRLSPAGPAEPARASRRSCGGFGISAPSGNSARVIAPQRLVLELEPDQILGDDHRWVVPERVFPIGQLKHGRLTIAALFLRLHRGRLTRSGDVGVVAELRPRLHEVPERGVRTGSSRARRVDVDQPVLVAVVPSPWSSDANGRARPRAQPQRPTPAATPTLPPLQGRRRGCRRSTRQTSSRHRHRLRPRWQFDRPCLCETVWTGDQSVETHHPHLRHIVVDV